MVVDRAAIGIGIGRGPGGVEKDEDAEVSGELAALQVDLFGRRVASVQVDEQIDEGFDVDVVAVGTAAEDLGAEAEARQASAEQLVVLHGGVRDVGYGAERVIDDSAVLRPVPVVVNVPLRVEGAAHADGRAGRTAGGEVERDGKRPGIRPDARHPTHRPR